MKFQVKKDCPHCHLTEIEETNFIFKFRKGLLSSFNMTMSDNFLRLMDCEDVI